MPKNKKQKKIKPPRNLRQEAIKSKLPYYTPSNVFPPQPVAMNRQSPKMAAFVKKYLDDAHRRLDIGTAGVKFMECCLNPFGVNHAQGPKAVGARVPDANVSVVPLTLTAATNFPGSTSAFGVIECRPPNLTDAPMIMIHRGTDPSSPSNTPTGTDVTYANETGILDAIIDQTYNDPRIRIVSMALRVIATSSEDATSGLLEAFVSTQMLRTAAGAWQQYGYALDEPVGVNKSAKEGMQVRTAFNFEDPAVAVATQYVSLASFAKHPFIRFTGLGTGTTLHIESVVHLEVCMAANSVPFPVPDLMAEPELTQIVDIIASAPCVVEGNSFKSFMSNLWKFSKKALNYVADHSDQIGNVAAQLLKL